MVAVNARMIVAVRAWGRRESSSTRPGPSIPSGLGATLGWVRGPRPAWAPSISSGWRRRGRTCRDCTDARSGRRIAIARRTITLTPAARRLGRVPCAVRAGGKRNHRLVCPGGVSGRAMDGGAAAHGSGARVVVPVGAGAAPGGGGVRWRTLVSGRTTALHGLTTLAAATTAHGWVSMGLVG
jgi:hypothetical protein